MPDSLSAQWIIVEDDFITFFTTITIVVFRRAKFIHQGICVEDLYLELYLIWLANSSIVNFRIFLFTKDHCSFLKVGKILNKA